MKLILREKPILLVSWDDQKIRRFIPKLPTGDVECYLDLANSDR